jgi:predicted alpha/beta-hydrolase family hydrolase
VCIETVRSATQALAERLGVRTGRIAVGGRSFGGRMCSLAVAQGLSVAALVLVSYPLHPPGKPERLRTEHFPQVRFPCLFVSGRKDAFATPDELEREVAAIPGPVTVSFVEGDHSLRRSEAEVATVVASWLAGLGHPRRR